MDGGRRLIAEGHLIDSGLMSKFLDIVVENGGSYQLLKFDIGRTVSDFSRVEMTVTAPEPERLARILENLTAVGCHLLEESDEIELKPAEKDGTVPDDFYSTTNHRTRVFHRGTWLEVERQRMDAVIVVKDGSARCVKLRDVEAGDRVICGIQGVHVFPPFRDRAKTDFIFMNNEVSSERRVELAVAQLAAAMKEIRARRGKTIAVVGPVVVHTGGSRHLCSLIRGGYVQGLLSGNAIGVHDVESALLNTSLGVDVATGIPVSEGHKNHMRAINAIRKCGSLAEAVEKGVLRSGLMYECIVNGVRIVLAGSIRDDGPLPDTIMDMRAAQETYADALEGADLVLILGTMLHGIGVGNMTPSWVRTVCVDINPAVVTKLVDRGSAQASGIVTDVGLFLRLLAEELEAS
ncbi:MAG TPA: TIGR00300 family protein [Candidatus Polarisedimenticolia bacterium]|jgi:lysine-ketoglutarate reductase/saccharopine dehydrogenase-like protein (TIGR00300 family)